MSRIAILIEGFEDLSSCKTALSVMRYRERETVKLIDPRHAGSTAKNLLGVGGSMPVVGSLAEGPEADTLLLGTASPGGGFSESWRSHISEALRRGMEVISGLHVFLGEDPELTRLAEKHGGRIFDVRKNQCRDLAWRKGLREECLRIHTVGSDCNVGKMVVSIEIAEELKRRGVDAMFVATGQTGIMIAGSGIPIDCVVSDFVNGAAERLVLDNQHHDILLIEGQGAILNPAYSSVTCGLLHGCAPHGLVLCTQLGRRHFRHTDIPIPPLEELIDLYETFASPVHPCRIIGLAVNGRDVTTAEVDEEIKSLEDRFNLPVADVYRYSASPLADAVESLRRELQND